MLNHETLHAGSGAGLRPPASRRSAVLAAVGPTARVAHLGAAALTVALAAIPSVVTVVRGDTVVSTPLIMAGLLLGATLAWAAEDQAAELLASLPVSSPVRTSLRVGLVAVVSLIGAALIALIVAVGPGLPPDVGDRLAETAAAAAAALSVGLVASRRGERATGPIGITAGVLTVGVIATLAMRWPKLLPALAAGPTHDRWWILALLGLAIAARAGRDSGRRCRPTGTPGPTSTATGSASPSSRTPTAMVASLAPASLVVRAPAA